jgi:hypothetical protein
MLEGDAGIGKTTLWAAGLDEARSRGFRILEARRAAADGSCPLPRSLTCSRSCATRSALLRRRSGALTNVYRKLNLRSLTELAIHVARQPP